MQNLSAAANQGLSGTAKYSTGSLLTAPQSGVDYRCRMIGLAVSFLVATSPVPVMDVLQVYGRLAGPECFGKTVPAAAGASC